MNVTIGRRTAVLVAAASVVVVAACGDSRVGSLSTGITRDSALKVLAGGASGDSLANVYKQESYIYDSRMINVLLYSRDGVKDSADPAVPDSRLTPVVLVDGKVTGWGWAHYDSVAKANNVPLRDHTK
jgi:hypothetical protein